MTTSGTATPRTQNRRSEGTPKIAQNRADETLVSGVPCGGCGLLFHPDVLRSGQWCETCWDLRFADAIRLGSYTPSDYPERWIA